MLLAAPTPFTDRKVSFEFSIITVCNSEFQNSKVYLLQYLEELKCLKDKKMFERLNKNV